MMMSRSFIKNSIESIEWSYDNYSCTICDALFRTEQYLVGKLKTLQIQAF